MPSEYKTVGMVSGVKVIERKDKTKKSNLPRYSNTKSTAYIQLDRNGNFKQYRKYTRKNKPMFDIDYGKDTPLGSNPIFHIHFFKGMNRGHGRLLTDDEMKKYGPFFKGIIV